VGRGVFLGGQLYAPTARGRGPSATQFGVSFYICIHPLRTTKFHVVTHMRGLNFRWSVTSHPQRDRVSKLLNFGGSFPFMCTLFVPACVEKRVYLDQQRLPSQTSGVSVFPNFGGSPLFMFTPFNAKRPNSAR